MKLFTNIILFLAIGSALFNTTRISLEKPFEGESSIAISGIVASLCAVVIVFIYRTAKKVIEKAS